MPMRREKRVLLRTLEVQQQVLDELDAEAYFTRGGRTTLREMIEEEERRRYVPRGFDPYFCGVWDEAHRQYDRDVEAGGNAYTREADRLAVLVIDWLCAGKEPEGYLITNCRNCLWRYGLDWNAHPELARLECAVLLYGVWTKIIERMNHMTNIGRRWAASWHRLPSEHKLEYNRKFAAERERRDREWLTSPRPRAI